jgi:hypothetical protein
MITLEEFDRVQFLMGKKGKPRPKKHTFAFTGFIRCGECGCLYTAETKRKFIKKRKKKRKKSLRLAAGLSKKMMKCFSLNKKI